MKRYVRELANDIQRYINSANISEENKDLFWTNIENTVGLYNIGYATEFDTVRYLIRAWESVKDIQN